MYQINRILNNTESLNMFNAAVNSNGSRIIVADTHLPDLSTSAPVPQTGSFKVYDIKYTPDMKVASLIQVGQTVVGATNESLGMGVGISGDGSLVLATSNTEVFKVYSYNRATSQWDVAFAAGTACVTGSEGAAEAPINIMGIRYDVDFKNIMTANVSTEGNTRLVYHVKEDGGALSWVVPAFSTDPVLLERYSRIRGLWMSDYSNDSWAIVHLQATNPETSSIRIMVTKFNADGFSDYGFIPEFSSDVDTNVYKSISVTINRKGTHIGVSYFKDNKVHLNIYAVDVDLNWNMVKKFSFALDTPNSERSSAIIFDDSVVGTSSNIPGKMMIAVTNGFSSDKFYGIYTNSFHPVTGEYSTSQEVSFGERLDSLAGNAAEFISFAGTVSKDFKVVLAAFAGPAGTSSSKPFGPAHYPSFPADGIIGTGDFNSEGISLALLVKDCGLPSPSSSCHDIPSDQDSIDSVDLENTTTVTIRTSKKMTLTLSTV